VIYDIDKNFRYAVAFSAQQKAHGGIAGL